MGVESSFYVMPATSGFRPDTKSVEELIRALMDQRFLPEEIEWTIGRKKDPGSIDTLRAALDSNSSSDIRILWRISDLGSSGFRYPPFSDS